MKPGRRILALLLLLCLWVGTALADTYYVRPDIESPLSLRDERTNEVLTTIPAGTALEPDGTKSTDLCAYVTYNGYAGLVLWNYLTRTAPGEGSLVTVQTPATPTPAPAAPEPTAVPGVYTLKAEGAYIQRADSKNKPAGAEMNEMTVTAGDNVIVTARVPRGKKIEYWVLNGVRYEWLHTVKWIRLSNFDRSWTVEVVYKNSPSATLHDPAAVQAARTGETLLCRTVSAELCHIKSGTKGGGGWITSFDFTQDYVNRATGVMEKGGQLSAKVRAVIPRGKRVAGWKLDETHLYPAVAVKEFVVRSLDTSMTYEPIFGNATVTKPPVTDPPTPTTRYVTVNCYNCTFSGGGYSNATSGSVPVGTTISVRSTGTSSENYWEINGSTSGPSGSSFKRVIKVNTTIKCYPVIN